MKSASCGNPAKFVWQSKIPEMNNLNENLEKGIEGNDNEIDNLVLERKKLMMESIKIKDRYEESRAEKERLMVMSKIIENLMEKNLESSLEYDDNDTFNLGNDLSDMDVLEGNINWSFFDKEILSSSEMKNLGIDSKKIWQIAQLNELEIKKVSQNMDLASDFFDKARNYEDVDKILRINAALIKIKNEQISYLSR